jgi:hypothetical protein
LLLLLEVSIAYVAFTWSIGAPVNWLPIIIMLVDMSAMVETSDGEGEGGMPSMVRSERTDIWTRVEG